MDRDDARPFLLDLDPAFEKLYRKLLAIGFGVLDAQRSDSFGDRYVDITDGHLAIRFVSDRGLWNIDVAPTPRPRRRDWKMLQLWAELLGWDVVRANALTPVRDQSAFLRDHLEAIRAAVQRDEKASTTRGLEALASTRAERTEAAADTTR